MHPDAKIVMTYGPPIGFAVIVVGLLVGVTELVTTGVGMAGAAVVVGVMLDRAADYASEA